MPALTERTTAPPVKRNGGGDILDSLQQESAEGERPLLSARQASQAKVDGRDRPESGLCPSPSKAAFSNECLDYSKLNHRVCGPDRKDTFQPQSMLGKRQASDLLTKLDKRWGLGDARDFLQICELAFARSMSNVTQDVIQGMKEEMQISMGSLRQEMQSQINEIARVVGVGVEGDYMSAAGQPGESMLNLDADLLQPRRSLSSVVAAVMQKMETVEDALVKRPEVPKADMEPVRVELEKLVHLLQQEVPEMLASRCEGSFKANLLRVSDQLARLDEKQDAYQGVVSKLQRNVESGLAVPQLEVGMGLAQRMLSQVLGMQEHLVADFQETSCELKRFQEENIQHHSRLVPSLEMQLTRFVKQEAVTVDFGQVYDIIRRARQDAKADASVLQSEIARIQQALSLEYEDGEIEMARTTSGQVMSRGLFDKPTGGKDEEPPPPRPKVKRRMREYFCQTDKTEVKDAEVQTLGLAQTMDAKAEKGAEKRRKEKQHQAPTARRFIRGLTKPIQGPAMFADKDALKEKMRQAMMKEQYNVVDFYHETGFCRQIATHQLFEQITFAVILFNSAWIAVDTDYNKAAVLNDAAPLFQAMENLFCCFFTVELAIRFGAFHLKRDAMRDKWFVFDSFLLAMMIMDTWLLTIIVAIRSSMTRDGSHGFRDASVLRLGRLVKVLRLSRTARLLRSVPELVILMKGVVSALRSMAVFVLLWTLLVYIFAVFLRHVTDDSEIGLEYFETVPHAMNTLVLDGILPGSGRLVHEITVAVPLLYPVLMIFVLIAAVTLMYMLIGVLVDVVTAIATTEKEAMIVSDLATQLRNIMYDSGFNPDLPLSKMEFHELLYAEDVVSIVKRVHVDPTVLVDMADVIFDDIDKDGQGMRFEQFVELILNMRGQNPATVKDIKQQMLVMKGIIRDSTDGLLKKIREEISMVKLQIHDMIIERDESDAEVENCSEPEFDERLTTTWAE
eukprot:TRINITY_DN2695_c0_g1_i1.p1 TRINITY_DN2695_c0_g1~~TRINITY_DN2695_c0_g1_i1.p1  ORF type:complete len:988 (-),score=302.05 TRINITY_DN2695_c0_g1_i1:112-2994(-)